MRDVAPDVTANLASADRVIVLVLDDAQVRANPVMTRATREAARQVIDRLGPNDLAAIVFTRNNSGAQPFTTDRSRLLAAVEKFSGGFGGSTGPGDWSVEYFYKSTLRTLRSVAQSMAAADQRRKAVIFLSPGLPLNPNSGLGSSSLQPEATALFSEAQRANVNIYSLDPSTLGGLDGEDPKLSALPEDVGGRVHTINNDFLHALAANTGGLAIVNSNALSAGVTQIFRENGSYYLIGYRSPGDQTPGRYRRVEVRVYRPDLTVRARNGYYGPKTVTDDGDPTTPLQKALASVVPARDVAMQVTAAPFAVPGKRDSTMALILAVRERAPPPGESRIKTNVGLVVGAYGPDGRRIRAQQLNATVLLRAESGRTVQYEILSEMRLRAGRYQLRFAADSSLYGKRGSVYCDVDVPDFSKGELTASGLVLSSDPNVASAPRDAFAKLIPVVPTSRRNFWRTTDRVEAFLRLYQDPKKGDAVTVKSSIRDSADRTVFETSEVVESVRFTKTREADYRLELPIEKLDAGPYLLTIEANTGQTSIRRDVRFVIQ
jgi:VWFA-related protein